MKKLVLILAVTSLFPFMLLSQNASLKAVNKFVDQWHLAAAEVNMEAYFDKIDENGIFIGTDATENWTKQAFYEWSKPHFNEGKAWSFTATERNVFFSDDGKIAWFDEKLDFSGGELRGSGVLILRGDEWKIAHYVLSLPVPNDDFKAVLEVMSSED